MKRKRAWEAEKVLTQALELLDSGKTTKAVTLLEQIATLSADDVKEATSTLAYENEEDSLHSTILISQYNLALALLCQGKAEAADQQLRKLGFNYRLHRSLFVGGEPVDKQEGENLFHVFDAAIPEVVNEHLKKGFSPTSPFWPEHMYEKQHYFSYNYPLDEAPRNSIEKVIKTYILPRVLQAFPSVKPVHAEWWVSVGVKILRNI